MKKRVWTLLLVFLLLFCTLGAPEARADESGLIDGVVPWTLDTTTGELVIGQDGMTYDFADLGLTGRSILNYGYLSYSGSIRRVSFAGTVIGHGSMASMFDGCSNLVSVNLSNYNTADVNNMSNMFSGCSSLTGVNLSPLNTANVQQMAYMFSGCSSLQGLDLSGFSGASLTSMDAMFRACSSLTNITFGAFTPNAGTGMYDLFNGCSSLKTLDLTNFPLNTCVQTHMYYGMSSLESLTLGTGGSLAFDCGFEYLPGYWASSTDSYGTIYDSSGFMAAYPAGTAAQIERGASVIYHEGGATATRFGRFSTGTNYILEDIISLGLPPPAVQQLRAWRTAGGAEYAAGSGIDILSLKDASDNVDLTAVLEYDVTWTWSADGTAASANYTDSGFVAHTVPADSITVLSDTSTCDAAGVITRRASVVIEGLTYTDDHGVASPAHHRLSYVAAVEPGCETDGTLEHWHCSVCGKDFADAGGSSLMTSLVAPRVGHRWGAATYVWSADHSTVTATRRCTRDASHIQSETRPSTGQPVSEPSCETAGRTTYTSENFTNPAFTWQRVTVSDIPALGHDPFPQWAADEHEHWHICRRCSHRVELGEHESSGAATVERAERCTVCDYMIRPPLVILSSVRYYNTGSTEVPPVVLRKEKDDVDTWSVTLPREAPIMEGYYFEGWDCTADDELYRSGETLSYTFAGMPTVGFRAQWTMILGVGSYELESATRYRLASGSLTVAGDDTVYRGDQYVYVPGDGRYVFEEGGAS